VNRILRASAAAFAAAALLAIPAASSAAPAHPGGPHPAFVIRCPADPFTPGQFPGIGNTGQPVPLAGALLWFRVGARDMTVNWAYGVQKNHVFPCAIWKLPYYNSPHLRSERIIIWSLRHGWWGAFNRRGGNLIYAWREWFRKS
jgi:hypothetical protein